MTDDDHRPASPPPAAPAPAVPATATATGTGTGEATPTPTQQRRIDQQVPRGEVRRGVRVVTLAFVLTFVPAAVGLSFVPLDDDSGADLLFVAAGLGFLAASVACTVVSFRLLKQAGAVIGRDHDRARRIGKAVLSRRPLELGPDDERAAARWASVSAVSLPVQYAQSATLFAGLICNQLPQALGEDGWIFSRVLLVVMAAMLLGFAPFFLTRASHARRYAAARAHLLPPSAADTAGSAGTTGPARPPIGELP